MEKKKGSHFFERILKNIATSLIIILYIYIRKRYVLDSSRIDPELLMTESGPLFNTELEQCIAIIWKYIFFNITTFSIFFFTSIHTQQKIMQYSPGTDTELNGLQFVALLTEVLCSVIDYIHPCHPSGSTYSYITL